MIHINSGTFIYQPIKRVFDFISTPENDFQWQYGTLASSRISEGATKVGTFFRSIGHLMGRRVQGTYEVTEYEPNRKYGFKSLSGPLLSHTSYTFELADGSTKVNISTRASAINLLLMEDSVLEKRMKKQLKDNLAMLKNILEARQIIQPPADSRE